MKNMIKKITGIILSISLACSSFPVAGLESEYCIAAEAGTLQNGALTTDTNGWTIGGDFAETGDSYGYGCNDGYLSIWNNDSEVKKFSISQTVKNVAAGDYSVKLAAVGNGNKGDSQSKDSLQLEVRDDAAGLEKNVKIVTDGWDNWDNIVSTEKFSVREGASVTITISGAMEEKDWYGIKNIIFDTDTTVEAPISVKKVEGLSRDFIHGVDVSSYLSEVQSGVTYYDEHGKETDLFDLLQDAGVNYVRLRVWNCPYMVDAQGNYLYADAAGKEYNADQVVKTSQHAKGYYEYFLEDGTQVYRKGYGAGNCDIDTAAAIGKIATEHGMKVLIDFHYSDFWADPNKQRAPKAWDGMTVSQKETALAKFTEEGLRKLKEAGVDVGMVQIGNEINNGMAGEKDMANICTLLKAGSKAVRAVDPGIMIAVHYTDPQSEGYQLGKAWELEQAGVDYDVFATSYYPFWHGSPEQLAANLKQIADTYNKKVMVAEISYAWTLDDGDGYGNNVSETAGGLEFNYAIEADGEGQAAAVRDAIAAVASVGEKGIGTFYWEPAWIPVNQYNASAENAKQVWSDNVRAWNQYGSGWGSAYAKDYDPEVVSEENGATWENQAFFDFSGKVLPSINVYKWVYTGAKGPKKVTTVDSAVCTMGYHKTPVLPKKVAVNFNDETVQEVAVTWNAAQVKKLASANFGEYTVEGKVGAFSYETRGETVSVAAGKYKSVCTVTVTGKNYVTNGGFEANDGSAEGWKVKNYLKGNQGAPKVDKSSSNAKSGLYYYTGWDESKIDFKLEQTVKEKPENGTYMLFAYYQGTAVEKLTDKAELYAVVTYKNGTTKKYHSGIKIKNVWKDWYQAKVPGIKITSDVKSVKIGTRIACTGKSPWVVVDDISLMQTSKDISKLSVVKNIALKNAKKNTVTVSYKKVLNADGYKIEYSADKNFKDSNVLTTSKLSKNITKLKKGKVYYVRVRAYAKNSDGKRVYGKYSDAIKIKVAK